MVPRTGIPVRASISASSDLTRPSRASPLDEASSWGAAREDHPFKVRLCYEQTPERIDVMMG
jgi:hypothetical protein